MLPSFKRDANEFKIIQQKFSPNGLVFQTLESVVGQPVLFLDHKTLQPISQNVKQVVILKQSPPLDYLVIQGPGEFRTRDAPQTLSWSNAFSVFERLIKGGAHLGLFVQGPPTPSEVRVFFPSTDFPMFVMTSTSQEGAEGGERFYMDPQPLDYQYLGPLLLQQLENRRLKQRFTQFGGI